MTGGLGDRATAGGGLVAAGLGADTGCGTGTGMSPREKRKHFGNGIFEM